MKRSIFFAALAAVTGCYDTSGTEIGVRTNLFGIMEKRGEQEIYGPAGVYFFLPIVNSWQKLPISQQNLLMNANPNEGDRPVPDDITFKTRDGNNVHIDVNVLWRVDPKKAGYLLLHVGQSIDEIMERIVRPYSRAIIRDVFNAISSEEYYHVAAKNEMAQKAKDVLQKELEPFGIIIDMLQVQQHRFDKEYQSAIDAQKQAEADVQKIEEQQKAMEVQKKSELEAKRAQWNQSLEEARGEAGRAKNDADGYYQKRIGEAKGVLARAKAESDAKKKEAEALQRAGGDAYVKVKLAQKLAEKRVFLVPNANVTTANVNDLLNFLLSGKSVPAPKPAAP